MLGFRRLASAARGTLWLLRATGLRDHFARVESHLNDLDTKVLHVASQSATALRMADNVQRLEKQITDVMTDVTSQHTTTVRVAENVQRLGKHIVDVAANNLTNGRLSEQFQKLEKHISELGAGHLTNGKLSEQFQKLEKYISDAAVNSLMNGKLSEQFQKLEKHIGDVAANSMNVGKLAEQFHKLEKHLENVVTSSQSNGRLCEQFHKLENQLAGLAANPITAGELGERFQKLEQQIADLAAGHSSVRELSERCQRLEQHLEGGAPGSPAGQFAERVQRLEQRLEEIQVRMDRAIAGLAEIKTDAGRRRDQMRWLQSQDLRAYERRVYSQNGEDGIIQEILHRIGVEARHFVAFGIKSGIESNCARLVLQENWNGLFVESDNSKFQQLTECYQSNWGVRCVHAKATSRNVEQLLADNGVPFNLDVLSLDIDGNDYWVWNAVNRWRPRLLVIEYNSSYPPSKKWVMQENLDHQWNGTNYYGASLASLTALGRKKGYALVATDSHGKSAFFVKDDLMTPEKFLDPVVHYHYSAPHLGPFLGGHPPGSGPCAEV